MLTFWLLLILRTTKGRRRAGALIPDRWRDIVGLRAFRNGNVFDRARLGGGNIQHSGIKGLFGTSFALFDDPMEVISMRSIHKKRRTYFTSSSRCRMNAMGSGTSSPSKCAPRSSEILTIGRRSSRSSPSRPNMSISLRDCIERKDPSEDG